MIEIPIGWIAGVIIGAGGVISTMAGVMWSMMKERLKLQDRIIEKLQADIERMSNGCGIDSCIWRGR